MHTATKTGIDAAKTASKRVVQKTAEAAGDLIRNNQKKRKKQTKQKKFTFHQKKDNKLLMTSNGFENKISLLQNQIMQKRNKSVVFKNNAPFIKCISKVNGVKTNNVEDFDVTMPMYNLLEYSKNYRKTAGSLWNY